MNGKSEKEIDTVKIEKELPRRKREENREREKMKRRKREKKSKRDLLTWNGGRENNLKVFPNTVCERNDVTSSFHPPLSLSLYFFLGDL